MLRRSTFYLLTSFILTACSGLASSGGVMRGQAAELLPAPTTVAPAGILPSTPTLQPEVPAGEAPLPFQPTSSPTASLPPTALPSAIPAQPTLIQQAATLPFDVNPLTGLPLADPGLLERLPIAIKVTNFPRSVRPQWGLSAADHVYEYYIGDYMSRFIAIYYGNDASRVGPVRSARLFDVQVVNLYTAIFVFGWADDAVLEFLITPELLPRLVVERPTNCPPLCRMGPAHAYNTLFADTSQIANYLGSEASTASRPNLDGLRFDSLTPKSGNPGRGFSLDYSDISYHRWEYDPNTGSYLRFQETGDATRGFKDYQPLTDSLDGQILSANNVIILQVPHTYYYQSTSTEIIDQPLTGSGQGYAFRDGWLYPLAWSREADHAMLRLTLPNGERYPLKPGNTWFEVIGESSLFVHAGEGHWAFEFSMP